MTFDNETIRALERLHVRAWPATETARIGGWLWRASGGGSQRANSVSTVEFTGTDPIVALDEVERRYRARGATVRLHTYALGRPEGLAELLSARGYSTSETTITMAAIAGPGVPPADAPRDVPGELHGEVPVNVPGHVPADIIVTDQPSPGWLNVYLEAITESRRAVNREILRRVPDPRAFFTVRRDGPALSTALGVVHGGHAVAECVATRADGRGQRGAEAAMRALMLWAGSLGAHTVGLQVVETNAPALALYRRLGFVPVCANQFWVKP